jgi:hypothetical protein
MFCGKERRYEDVWGIGVIDPRVHNVNGQLHDLKASDQGKTLGTIR